MSDYTPTTEEVRDRAVQALTSDWGIAEAYAEFDRWLAERDAEREAIIRADEREQAAGRVRRAWADEPRLACGRFQHVLVDTAVAAARGGEQE